MYIYTHIMHLCICVCIYVYVCVCVCVCIVYLLNIDFGFHRLSIYLPQFLIFLCKKLYAKK